MSRTPARFDEAELRTLSAKTLPGLPFAAMQTRLADAGIAEPKAEPFWMAVRGNLFRFGDVEEWWKVVEDRVAPVVEDQAFLEQALALLPQAPWTLETWTVWTEALKASSGRRGRALFHPLRLALTARETGPDLKHLLPLIGRVKASARLAGIAA